MSHVGSCKSWRIGEKRRRGEVERTSSSFSIIVRLSSSNRLSCRFRPISTFDISPKRNGQSRGVWAVLEEEGLALRAALVLGPADGLRQSKPPVGRGRVGSKPTTRSGIDELGA